MSEEVSSVHVSAQVTPNPNTLKFMVNQVLLESGSYNFQDRDSAAGSYLPEFLFGIDGVDGVMVGTNFVSVTKTNDLDWADIASDVVKVIKEAVSSGELLIDDSLKTVSEPSESDSEVVSKIKAILDSEIRPAVAMDGGDVNFYSFDDGVLTLQLQGACSSCPSAIMTLKMGIENRLKEDIPELKEVVQL